MKTSRLCLLAASFLCLLATPAFAQPKVMAIVDLATESGLSSPPSGPNDSVKSVVFFDATSGQKMFAVAFPFERAIPDRDEPSAITVNPRTGDIYAVAFDSGTPGTYEGLPNGIGDTSGDLDLFKIDFSHVYNDWVANGKTTKTYNAFNNFYDGTTTNGSHQAPRTVLPGSVIKIGEVARNQTSAFFDYGLQFVNENTLLLMDNINDSPAQDFTIRALNRVSTSPGLADGVNGFNSPGGAGVPNAESWHSSVLGRLAGMDAADNAEPYDFAYHKDPVSGVEGVWILESDGGLNDTVTPANNRGDEIAFFQITNYAGEAGNGLRPFSTGSTSFILDDDASDPNANNGRGRGIHIDAAGNLVIIEDGFGDVPADEPGVVLRTITNYENGSGQILAGGYAYTQMNFTGVTDDDTATNVTDARITGYDKVNNVVYYVDLDNSADPSGKFDFDLYALDLDTGVTSLVAQDPDNLVFFTPNFADRATFFAAHPGDFDWDGDVDGADFVAWQTNFPKASGATLAQGDADGDGDVDGADFVVWQTNFPFTPASPGTSPVPEPAAWMLAGLAIPALAWLRRKSRN